MDRGVGETAGSGSAIYPGDPERPGSTCNMANCTNPGVWLVQFGWGIKLYLCDDDAKRIKGKKELAEHESPTT